MINEVRGRIVELRTIEDRRLALVDIDGTRRPVFLDRLPNAQVGDYIIVRGGFATQLLDSASQS